MLQKYTIFCALLKTCSIIGFKFHFAIVHHCILDMIFFNNVTMHYDE